MTRVLSTLAGLALALAGCGGDPPAHPVDGGAGDGAPIDAGAVDGASALALTSPALTEGGAIPIRHSCKGDNVSPPLAWTGAIAPSWAVVLTDRSNNLVHAAIWDIPGAATGLPENIAKVAEPPDPAGSKQALAYDNQTPGYLGPCPQSQHTYEWKLYAVDAATLAGVTLQATRGDVVAALTAHATATATLTATFTP